MVADDENVASIGYLRIVQAIKSRVAGATPLPQVLADLVVDYVELPGHGDHFVDVLGISLVGEWSPNSLRMSMIVKMRPDGGNAVGVAIIATSECGVCARSFLASADELYGNFSRGRLAEWIENNTVSDSYPTRYGTFDNIDDKLQTASRMIAISLCEKYVAAESRKTIVLM